jgi:hypothetical protein
MSDDSGSEESSDVQEVIKQITIQFCSINSLFEIN